MKINFNKVLTLPKTLVAGQIYYVDDIKSIVVAESDTKYVVYDNTPEIQSKINEILGGASDSYNTLKKIEDIIGSIVETQSEFNESLNNKVDKDGDKVLSDNNFSDEDKTKLDSLSNFDDTEIWNTISNKVDKVGGKQLSTEDFTTALKEKLQNLNNYDDSEINKSLENIQGQINTLVNGNASEAIESFNEIIAFLEGVEDSEDLASIMAAIEQQIANVQNSIPTKVSLLENDVPYLTEHQDISHLATKKEVTDAIQENTDAIDTLSGTVTSNTTSIEEINSTLSTKADINGDYPDMSVGLAEDLGGRPFTNDAEFSFRATADKENSIKDGLASIKTLKGNSVVWNQLWDSNNIISRQCSFTVNNGVYTITPQDEKLYLELYCLINKPVGHHMLISYDIQVVSDKDFVQEIYLGYFGSPTQWFNGGYGPSLNSLKTRTHIEEILELDTDKYAVFIGCPYTKNTADGVYTFLDSSDRIYIYYPRVIDLTLMFGEGNEPTTIEEFYSRCPIGIDMNAYNKGEVIHMNAEGIRSIGFNQLNLNRTLGTITSGSGNTPLRPEILDESLYFIGLSFNNYYNPSNITDYSVTENSVSNTSTSGYGVSFARRCLSNTEYCVQHEGGLTINVGFYDDLGNYISDAPNLESGETFTTPKNATWMNIVFKDSGTYTNPCVSLNYSYNDGEYKPYEEFTLNISDQRIKDEFPDGMKKWDKVYNKDGKGYIVKGTGVVDMGTLEWQEGYGDLLGNQTAYYVTLDDSSFNQNNILTSRYSIIPVGSTTKGILKFTDRNLVVADPSYTDAASFKAAMAGVPLYYELAEPTIIEYDEPFNLDYKVADFGTEQAIGNSPSAPISAEIEYDFGANDTIRTNKLAINELREKIKNTGNVVAVEINEAIDDVDTTTYVKYVAQSLTEDEQMQARNNIGAETSYEYYQSKGGYLNEETYNVMIKYLFTPFMVSRNSVTTIPDDLLNDSQTMFVTDYYWNIMRITGGEPFVTTQWSGNKPYKFKGILNNETFVIDFANKTITPES